MQLPRIIHKLALRLKIYYSPDEKARHSPRFARWRQKVFQRDRYTCQMCGKQGGKLNPHHIRQWSRYPKLRFAVNNGITLCEKPCHEKTFHNEDAYIAKFDAIIRRKQKATQNHLTALRKARKQGQAVKMLSTRRKV